MIEIKCDYWASKHSIFSHSVYLNLEQRALSLYRVFPIFPHISIVQSVILMQLNSSSDIPWPLQKPFIRNVLGLCHFHISNLQFHLLIFF